MVAELIRSGAWGSELILDELILDTHATSGAWTPKLILDTRAKFFASA
jgi:hypothetical protein